MHVSRDMSLPDDTISPRLFVLASPSLKVRSFMYRSDHYPSHSEIHVSAKKIHVSTLQKLKCLTLMKHHTCINLNMHVSDERYTFQGDVRCLSQAGPTCLRYKMQVSSRYQVQLLMMHVSTRRCTSQLKAIQLIKQNTLRTQRQEFSAINRIMHNVHERNDAFAKIKIDLQQHRQSM